MSVITIDPLPIDVQESLTRLADSAGLDPCRDHSQGHRPVRP